ncbi:zinc-binding dehydrogenase [Herpetosiphon sp. NSE202]|uniref:zinc-binding dehydrogenase n=1 Tax=Herpetosiphon sp. NSE202 TaxID=3351349 RepID=UPI00362A80B7
MSEQPTFDPTIIRTKALIISDYSGDLAKLTLVERNLRPLKAHEVLVKVAATPINPSDMMFINGSYGITKPLPAVPGFEGSGTIVSTGDQLYSKVLLGKRVSFATQAPEDDGAWADYVIVAARQCLPLAESLSFEQAASAIVNPVSAWALIDIARQRNAKVVVQTAAASQLGRMLVRLAQREKLTLINIVRREAQVELLQSLGAEYVLNSSSPDFAEALSKLCHEQQAQLAFDAVGGELVGQVLSAMPKGSTMMVYGALADSACQIDPRSLIFEQKHVTGFWLTDWIGQINPLNFARITKNVQKLLLDELTSTVQGRFKLHEAQNALELYQANMTGGKVLFTP